MRLWSEVWERLRALLHRSREEREMEEEIRFHLDREAERLAREERLSRSDAERRARIAFGGVERYKEEVREARGTRGLEEAAADLAGAGRALRRHPAFASAAVATLALGIGAATTVFGLFDAAYLDAFDYPDADRLVALWQDHRGQGGPEEERFNPPDFATLREGSRTLEAVAAMTGWSPTLTGSGTPQRLEGLTVSHEYFDLFGARPLLGRFPSAADERPAGEPGASVVVVDEGLWLRRFGGDPDVVGAMVELDGSLHRVVGVAPSGFQPPGPDAEIWRPVRTDPTGAARMFHVYDVVGGLAADASTDDARAELDALATEIAETQPESNAGVAFRVAPLEERVLGPVRPALFALLGGVGLLLLAACTNVGGLLLARGAERERGVAVRAVLGASRPRLLRALLAEGILLGLLGGGAGVAVAAAGTRLVSRLLPTETLPDRGIVLDPEVAAGAVALGLATTLAFTVVPALRLSDVDPARGLERAAGARSTGRSAGRDVLVVAEIALSSILLVGAAHFLRTFADLLRTDPGFRTEHVVTAELSLPGDRYPDGTAISRFYDGLLDELRRRPGVRSAGATSFLPLRGGGNDVSFRIEGRSGPARGNIPLAWYRVTTSRYFRTMGIPVLEGGAFGETDGSETRPVVMVNATLARRHWPDGDAVGARLSPEWSDGAWLTVVGVVADVRHDGLAEDPRAELYFPHARMAGTAPTMAVVVRTAGDEADGFAPTLREAVRSLDPDLPVEEVAAMDDVLSRSLAMPRLHAWTFGLFAGLALTLAAVGLYAVVSTVVARRTREIGVRIALGAAPSDLVRWVLRRSAVLGLVGAGLGVPGGLAFSRALGVLLEGPGRAEPVDVAAVLIVLTVTVLSASLLPARRAASADPVAALGAG